MKLWKASVLDDAASKGLPQHLDVNAFDDMGGMLIDDKKIYAEVQSAEVVADKKLISDSQETRADVKVKSLKDYITGEKEEFNPDLFNQPAYYIEKIEATNNEMDLETFLSGQATNISMFGDKDQQLIYRVADTHREKLRKLRKESANG